MDGRVKESNPTRSTSWESNAHCGVGRPVKWMDGNLISLHFRIDNNLFRGGEASPSVTTYYYPVELKKMVHISWTWPVDRCRWWFIELKIRVTAHDEIRLFSHVCDGSRFLSWRRIITDSSLMIPNEWTFQLGCNNRDVCDLFQNHLIHFHIHFWLTPGAFKTTLNIIFLASFLSYFTLPQPLPYR